jgi:hypothetical protein
MLDGGHVHNYDKLTSISEEGANLAFTWGTHGHSISGSTGAGTSHTHTYDKPTKASNALAGVTWTEEASGHNHGISGSVSGDSHSHSADNTQPDLYTNTDDGGAGHDHLIGRSTVDANVSSEPHSHGDSFSVDNIAETYITDISESQHEHNLAFGTDNGTTNGESAHTHGIDTLAVADTTSNFINGFVQAGHTHSLTFGVDNGTTDLETDHTHHFMYMQASGQTKDGGETATTTVGDSTHTHSLTFGIYRDTYEYNGGSGIDVEVYIDDGDGFPGTADYTLTTDANGVLTEELDIMADGKITQIPEDPETYDSWFKRIEFRIPTGTGQPERLRISGQLIAKIDITA